MASATETRPLLALERALTERVTLGGEWYGDDRTASWLDLGLRWAMAPHLSLGVSAAVQADTRRQRLISAGLTFGF